jgi:GNAT superfamily N-acetyltransferase
MDGWEGHPAVIREYRETDFDAVTSLWRVARELAFPDFQREKGHTFMEDCEYFQNVILENNDVWIAEVDGRVAGFLAIAGDFVDQLFVHPDFQQQGIGTALIGYAKHLAPLHLWLYTFQVNTGGRAFYEKNGFIPVRFGVSPEPESEPDVEFHWRPG